MAAGTARGVKGGHWLTTERGWCKAGSIMQVSEGVYYKTTRGDTDHPAYSARSSTSYPRRTSLYRVLDLVGLQYHSVVAQLLAAGPWVLGL